MICHKKEKKKSFESPVLNESCMVRWLGCTQGEELDPGFDPNEKGSARAIPFLLGVNISSWEFISTLATTCVQTSGSNTSTGTLRL